LRILEDETQQQQQAVVSAQEFVNFSESLQRRGRCLPSGHHHADDRASQRAKRDRHMSSRLPALDQKHIASMRRRMMSIAFRSLASSIVCVVMT